MIDPLFKSLEVLRQVLPGGVTLLIAPEDYDRDSQWLFVLTDTNVKLDYSAGFDPTCEYRFFAAKTGKAFAFRTGQEALKFAREEATNFNMERFKVTINSQLARAHSLNNKRNDLIKSTFPDKDMEEVYKEATRDAVIRKRLIINKLKESGLDVQVPTQLSLIKEDDT